jgi:hypothetical protein
MHLNVSLIINQVMFFVILRYTYLDVIKLIVFFDSLLSLSNYMLFKIIYPTLICILYWEGVTQMSLLFVICCLVANCIVVLIVYHLFFVMVSFKCYIMFSSISIHLNVHILCISRKILA